MEISPLSEYEPPLTPLGAEAVMDVAEASTGMQAVDRQSAPSAIRSSRPSESRAITVHLPSSPPQLSQQGYRILLEILAELYEEKMRAD
jgi:hypothetical protein